MNNNGLIIIMTHVRIIKKTEDLICLTYMHNKIPYFAKVFYLHNNKKLREEYDRELQMNTFISENLIDKTYHISLLQVHDNTMPFDFILPFISEELRHLHCNILVFEHSGNHTLRYYINRISTNNFNILMKQIKIACELLQNINVIHYDLYCESNIMVKKIKNKLMIRIIDYGLSYIDETDKTNYDYNTAIESISYYNKKHNN